MAKICLARHVHLSDDHHQELVALKVFSPRSPWTEHTLERIRMEVRASRKVMNRYVVRVYGPRGSKTAPGPFRWNMSTARPWHPCSGKASTRTTAGCPLGAAIAEGLHAAHMTDVVHRDLKPENTMIREDDTPVLLDFGVAKFFSQDAKLTAQDAVVGILLYMAPEQFHSVADPRSDQYALGLTLAQLITGQIARARDPIAKGIYIERVAATHQYHQRDHAPDAPRAYARIVDRLLAAAPDGRYPTGAHVVGAFKAIPRRGVDRHAPERHDRRRKPSNPQDGENS